MHFLIVEKQEYKHSSREEEHGLGKQKGKRRNEKERGRGEKEVGSPEGGDLASSIKNLIKRHLVSHHEAYMMVEKDHKI